MKSAHSGSMIGSIFAAAETEKQDIEQIADASTDFLAFFEGLDVEDLAYIVKKVARAGAIVARLKSDLRPNIAAGADRNSDAAGIYKGVDAPFVETAKMRAACAAEIADVLRKDPLAVARACIAASSDPKARKIDKNRFRPDSEERRDALLGAGNSLVELYEHTKKLDVANLSKHRATCPTSWILEDGKRVLLEWGAYTRDRLRENCLDLDDPKGETSEDGKILDRVLIEVKEEFTKVNHRHIEPKALDTDAGRVWIDRVPVIGLRWAICGFPLIVPSHKLAASLMATYLPPEYASEVKYPWHTFFVAVPNGMFEVTDPRMMPRMVGVSTAFGDGPKLIIIIAAGAVARFEPLASVSDLSDYKPEINDEIAPMVPFLARLLLGCMIEMDHPERKLEVAEREASTRKKEENGKKPSAPSTTAYELKRDVRVDLRDWVRNQISSRKSGGVGAGKHRSPAAVRILVRGHHKRQRCGIGGLLRKWIHVEAYWRGDEALPLAVRSHTLHSSRDE